jgi:hypothetical protein
MFATFLTLTLLNVNFLCAEEIFESSKNFVKNSKKHKRDYFPGVHQSINASGVNFSYDDLYEDGEKINKNYL